MIQYIYEMWSTVSHSNQTLLALLLCVRVRLSASCARLARLRHCLLRDGRQRGLVALHTPLFNNTQCNNHNATRLPLKLHHNTCMIGCHAELTGTLVLRLAAEQ